MEESERIRTVVHAKYDHLDLREAHQQLESRVHESIYKEKVPFVVGGGNGQFYPNA